MAGIVGLTEIQHTNGTSAATVDASGKLTFPVSAPLTPARPMMSVRGANASSANSAVFTNFQEVTGWNTTDLNIGGGLSNGRFVAPVTGNYHLEGYSHRGAATNYRLFALAVYDGSGYTDLIRVFAGNDYKGYTVGGSVIYPLTAGHEVLVGWDNSYSSWTTTDYESSFSCYLIG